MNSFISSRVKSCFTAILVGVFMTLVGCANTQPSTSQQVTEELVGSTVSPDELRVQLERLGAEGVLSQVDIKETDPPLYRVTGPQRVIQCLKSPQGVWREDYQECEFMSLQTCEALGGKFNGCASPCRHQPGMACITMCVPVCHFQQQ